MLDSAVAGLLTGLTLIVAIGAQNAFVLRQGLAREHVAVVVAICAVSDLLLIVAGVAGIGTIVERAAWALDAVRWFGVAFLTWYGVRSLLQARRAGALRPAAPEPMTRRSAVLTATALTWLNPHVYLDTVLLLGSIANTHGRRPLVVRRSAPASPAFSGSPRWASAPGCSRRCSPGPGPGRSSTC